MVEYLTQNGGVTGSSLTRGTCFTGIALIRRMRNCQLRRFHFCCAELRKFCFPVQTYWAEITESLPLTWILDALCMFSYQNESA